MNLYEYNNSKEVPTLFLHGFLGSSDSWEECIKIIKTYCITLNMPGHQDNYFNEKDTNYTIDNWCSELKTELDKRSIQSINLCGYSMGGRLAINFASRYPSLVNNLILESTTPGIKSKKERMVRYNSDLELCNKIESDYMNFIIDWEKNSLFENQFQKNKEQFLMQRKIRLSHKPSQICRSLKVFSQGRLEDKHSSISNFKFSVNIINGALDEKYTSIGKLMHSLCKNSMHHILNCGHNVHLEEPILYSKIVKNILNESI